MTIESEILGRLGTLLGKRELREAQTVDWWAGPADGGPNGDGRYPLTANDGTVRMVPSPAAIAGHAQSLNAAGVAGLAQGVPDDTGPDFRLIGVAQDGNPKRFAAPMIMARAIRDMPVVTQQISDVVLAGWSPQRQAALGNGAVGLTAGEIAAGVTGVVNPKITFGAKGDGRITYDLTTNDGSDIVSSNDAPFSAIDVGKLFYCTNGGPGYSRLVSTITQFIDAKHVRIAKVAGTSYAYSQAIWGTDDTVALQTWLNSLPGPGQFTFGRAGLLPEGIFLTRPLAYGSRMAIKGASRGASVLALIPGGDGPAQLYNAHKYVDFPVIKDLTLYGNMYLQERGIDGLSFISTIPGVDPDTYFTDPFPQFSDFNIQRTSGSGFVHVARGSGKVINFDIETTGYYGLISQGYDMHYYNFQIAASRLTGLYCGRFGSTGNDFRNFKVYFCGSDPYRQYQGGVIDYNSPGEIAWEDACNVFLGGAQQMSTGRLQESWGPNMVVGSTGSFCTDLRFDDTGCVQPRHNQGRGQLLSLRPAIMFVGANASDNIMNNMFITQAVHREATANYATQAVFFAGDNNGGYPGLNTVEMKVQRAIGPYSGSGTGAYAPGMVGTDNPHGYTTNEVINRFSKVIG